MAGTKEGGRKTAATLKKKYGKDHYSKLGVLGRKASTSQGFANLQRGKDGLTGPERASVVGTIGGHNGKKVK